MLPCGQNLEPARIAGGLEQLAKRYFGLKQRNVTVEVERHVVLKVKRGEHSALTGDAPFLVLRSACNPPNLNLALMRLLTAIPTCVVLLQAFLLAPFQHVHTGGADHDHAGFIHAHFNTHVESLPASRTKHRGAELDDTDDDHAAVWSVDTFTLVVTAGFSPFIPSLEKVLLFVPSDSFQPVEIVEQRGHDPPCIDRSIPRAPPA